MREAIRDGRLPAGTRLPSTRALAGDLGLSRGTVVEAFAQLGAEGYLGARHGAGTWVAAVSPVAVALVPAVRRLARRRASASVPAFPISGPFRGRGG